MGPGVKRNGHGYLENNRKEEVKVLEDENENLRKKESILKNLLESLQKENQKLKHRVKIIDKLEYDNKTLNTTLESNENEEVKLINEFNLEFGDLKSQIKDAFNCDECDKTLKTNQRFKVIL